MLGKRPRIEHTLIEVSGIEAKKLSKAKNLLPSVKEFIAKTGLHVLTQKTHDFSPAGVTMVFILSESHLAVHTWPEYGYFHLDLVTCSQIADKNQLQAIVGEIFQIPIEHITVRKVTYGN